MDPKRTIVRIPCPTCTDTMDSRRGEPQNVASTGGVCSECNAGPRRERTAIERERRVAAFGAGRC